MTTTELLNKMADIDLATALAKLRLANVEHEIESRKAAADHRIATRQLARSRLDTIKLTKI